MDFRAMYQEKLTTAEQAAAVVRSGDWVDFGWLPPRPPRSIKRLRPV